MRSPRVSPPTPARHSNAGCCSRWSAAETPAANGVPRVTSSKRSAALRVFSDFAYADLDLRVDLHGLAVDELRRCFEEYEPYRGYYRDRGRNPSDAVPQDVFVSRLVAAKI